MAGGNAELLALDGIHCEVAGSGPPVVFSHDGLLHSESWDAQFDAFADGYRVARWDRRGYGRSPRPTEPFSASEDLAAVVRAMADAPATLVGCSFGGYHSIRCALDHPALVAGLVLVGAVIAGLPFSEHFETRGGRDRPAPEAPDADRIAYYSERDPWLIAPANSAARSRLRTLLTANPQNLHPPFELQRPWPPPPDLPRLGEIAVPTLVVTGEYDIPDVHAHAGAIAAGVPGARRVVLPGAGHLPHLEVPAAFNRLLREFLTEVSS